MSDKIDLTTQSNIQFASNGNNNTGDGESTPTILDFLTGYASLQQKNITDAQFNILEGYASSLIVGIRLGTGADNKIYNDITDLNTLFQSGNYSFIYVDPAVDPSAVTAPSNSPVVNQSYTLTVQTRNETDGNDARTAGVMFKLATQTATVEGVRITRQGSFDGSSFNWSDWRIERGKKFIEGYSYKFGEDCIVESNESGVLYSKKWISVKDTANQGNNPQNIIDTTPYDYFNNNWRREKIDVFLTNSSGIILQFPLLASGMSDFGSFDNFPLSTSTAVTSTRYNSFVDNNGDQFISGNIYSSTSSLTNLTLVPPYLLNIQADVEQNKVDLNLSIGVLTGFGITQTKIGGATGFGGVCFGIIPRLIWTSNFKNI